MIIEEYRGGLKSVCIKKLVKIFMVINAIVILSIFVDPTVVLAKDNNSNAIEKLLSQTGYTYVDRSDATDAIWTIDFIGKSLPKYMVIITKADDLVIAFVTVAEKNNVKLTPDAMQKLLQANFSYDKVKIGLGRNGDLSIRIDQSIRITDLQEMKDNINQVAVAADELYAILTPYLIKN